MPIFRTIRPNLLAIAALSFLAGCESHQKMRKPDVVASSQQPSDFDISRRVVAGKRLTVDEKRKVNNPNTPMAETERLIKKAPHVEAVVRQ